MPTRSRLMLAIGIVVLAVSSAAHGQNCALRNPDRQIYDMFPEASRYQSVVAQITSDTRAEIERSLGSALRLREVGKHTLYVVLDGTAPIGFVHARAEIGKRGALELVWAYDLDLKLVDFRVQRCREKSGALIKSEAFRAKLAGTDRAAILALLIDGNRTVDLDALGLPSEAQSIAHTTVLCGATTRIITEIAFGQAVTNARLLGNVHRFFPDTAKVTKVNASLSESVLAAIENYSGSASGEFDRNSLVMLRSLSATGDTLGVLVFARWSAHPAAPELWLGVSTVGTVRSLVIVGEVSEGTNSYAAGLMGKALSELSAETRRPKESPIGCVLELLAALAALDITD